MALTLSKVSSTVVGNKRLKIYDVTFDSSYATGGESLTASDVGLRKVEHVAGSNLAVSSTPTAYFTSYDYTNAKLLAFTLPTPTGAAIAAVQVTGTTDLSAFTVRLSILGY